MLCVEESQVFSSTIEVLLLAHKPDLLPQKGKRLVKFVYKLCPTALYSVVQSHCSILSNDALHDCLSSNSSLQKGERARVRVIIFSATAEAVQKHFDYTSRGACLLPNR